MSTKSSTQIRNEFFEFFKEKEHLIVNSAPVVPKDDPSLLFTNAGMNQFKSIFLGEENGLEEKGKLWKRAANTQRCIRVSGKHNDLEEVGHDTYHHTLFEMLGNWSFGNYFKEEAIEWAWELLVDRWGMEPDRLYATVFGGDEEDGLPVDDESIELWKSKTSISPDHILKFGKKDNFWEMGETGPCGPCSEVHIDLRPDEERKKRSGAELVNMDDPRVMEIWNLVFIQFNRQKDGSLEKLPAQHVDTGMGFERLCAVLQGKRSNYDTDIFTPVLDKISSLSGKKYGEDEEVDIAMRVIADHIRAVSFSIADGASPSNEGRGYVVRRILRRAVRYGWDRLGFNKPFMGELVPVLAQEFKQVFPELHAQQSYVKNVVVAEEKSFLNTLGQGIQLFNEMVEGTDRIDGADAFKLHDTYGFPIDLTQLMAREKGITVDVKGFDKLMNQQKKRAREAGKFSVDDSGNGSWTEVRKDSGTFEEKGFVGYDRTETTTEIVGYRKEGEQFVLQLSETPFYAESGGQIADTGTLSNGNEEIIIKDVQKMSDGTFAHYVDTLPENLTGNWTAKVDLDRRREIEKHHSATHLMHAALRENLGKHVAQKGSLVDPNRLRFDFSHFEGVTDDQLDTIEKQINQKIQQNIPLQEERNVPIEEAKKRGAMMLFGEKYGDEVRVITFDPDYSVELCGGTHVDSTGKIGYFRFTNETSVAAGIRRVEAVVGKSADKLLREERTLVKDLKALLGDQTDPKDSLKQLLEEKKSIEKELKKLQQQKAAGRLDEILNESESINGVDLFTGKLEMGSMDRLKQSGYDALNKRDKDSVIVLATVNKDEDKVYMLAAISDDLVKKGMKAGDLVSVLGRIVGGGGGGQPNLATAGGRFSDKIPEAFESAKEWIKEHDL